MLYLPANPGQAMIDRGIFNVLLPGLLFAGAGVVIWLMVWLLRARRAELPQNAATGTPTPAANPY